MLRVEKILKKEGRKYELVPVPRNLSSDCGMCIKLADHVKDIKKHIEGIEMDKCFFFDGKIYIDLASEKGL